MEPALTDKNLKNLILKLPGAYKNATKHFVHFLNQNMLSISYKGLKAYIEFLKSPGCNYSSNTFNVYLAGLKNRIRFLFRLTPSYFDNKEQSMMTELLHSLKYDKIDIGKIRKIKFLTVKEIKEMIETAPDWLGLMIRFLFMTGTRVSEMLKIRYIDLKQDKKNTYITIKGKRERIINIETPFMYTIAKHFNGNTFLFETPEGKPFRRETVSMNIKRLGKKVLHRNISANTLRHTFAKLLIQKTGKLQGVSEYIGHKSIQTTIDMYVQQKLDTTDLDIVKI